MKIIFVLILCLCFAGAGKGQILLGTDLAVKVTVEAENPQIKEFLYKDLSRSLAALDQNIVIVGGEGAYLVKVQVVEIKSSLKSNPDYVLATIVSTKEYVAARRNKPAELIDRLLGDNLLLTTKEQLKETIIKIAAFSKTKILLGDNSKNLRSQHPPSKDRQ